MEEEDPYTVLQLKRTADVTEIRKSYQRLVRQVRSSIDLVQMYVSKSSLAT